LKEIELAAQISGLMKKNPIVIAGKTTIAQTANLIERCRLVVSNDSGLMHLAAAVGTNIVALFGPGDYNRVGPYGDSNKFVVVTKKVGCAPCYKVKCEDHKCMKNITVDDVFQAVEKLIYI
jgi:ADP-heptose:LPS heptosyltransferase